MLVKWAFGAFGDLSSELFRNCNCFLERASSYSEIEWLANGIAPVSGEIGSAISFGRSLSSHDDDYLVSSLSHPPYTLSSHTPRAQEMKVLTVDAAIGAGITIFIYHGSIDLIYVWRIQKIILLLVKLLI